MPNVYEIVTQKIIERIESAIKNGKKLTWLKGWNGYAPRNYITQRPYRGINLWLLPDGGEYITWAQLCDIHKKNPEIKLKKGCKKHLIVYWNIVEKIEEVDGEEVKKMVPLLRYYYVYHISDVEGLESKIQKFEHNPIEEAEKVIRNYCIRTNLDFQEVEGSDKAYYSPREHKVRVPSKNQFKHLEEYYSTVFHELGHASGKILGRFKEDDVVSMFNRESYSREELVAEFTAAMVCSSLGIETKETVENNQAYLQGWLSAIKNADSTFLVRAAAAAQKASDLILNVKHQDQEQEQYEEATVVA